MSEKKPLNVLVYFGGKSRAVSILEKLLPANTRELCSPFFGSGVFEIYCAMHKNIKVHASDSFEPLINFWTRMQKDPVAVISFIKKLKPYLTRAFYLQLESIICVPSNTSYSAREESLRAAMFFVVNRASWGGRMCGHMYAQTATRDRLTASIIARLEQVNLQNLAFARLDFRTAIKRCPSHRLLFLDPPYYVEGKDNYYGFRDTRGDAFPHEELRRLLDKRKRWILCYNNHPVIRKLYSKFTMRSLTWAYGGTSTVKGKELVIVSDDLSDAINKL
jgi:DNA adenine methylase